MSRKIIGVTVGTTLPKPNFKQTDPTKGDYIKNKPDFDGLQNEVEDLKTKVGDTSVSEQINTAIANISAITTAEIDEICEEQSFAYDESGNVSILSVFENSTLSYDDDGNVVINSEVN